MSKWCTQGKRVNMSVKTFECKYKVRWTTEFCQDFLFVCQLSWVYMPFTSNVSFQLKQQDMQKLNRLLRAFSEMEWNCGCKKNHKFQFSGFWFLIKHTILFLLVIKCFGYRHILGHAENYCSYMSHWLLYFLWKKFGKVVLISHFWKFYTQHVFAHITMVYRR